MLRLSLTCIIPSMVFSQISQNSLPFSFFECIINYLTQVQKWIDYPCQSMEASLRGWSCNGSPQVGMARGVWAAGHSFGATSMSSGLQIGMHMEKSSWWITGLIPASCPDTGVCKVHKSQLAHRHCHHPSASLFPWTSSGHLRLPFGLV